LKLIKFLQSPLIERLHRFLSLEKLMDPLSLYSKLPATSYFTLHIGLHHGRLWDLLGCEYYWGIIPHLIQGFLLWLFKTSSIEVIRVFNIFLGSVNAVLVYKIAYRYYSHENALVSGLCFAVFPLSAIFDSIGMQDVVGLFFFLLPCISCVNATFGLVSPSSWRVTPGLSTPLYPSSSLSGS